MSLNLIAVHVGTYRALTLRWYREPGFGYRSLGLGRFALDFGYLSLVFENYGARQ